MNIRTGSLVVLVSLAIVGSALVAAPPAKVPPAPPSLLVKAVDHLALQAGQHVEVPIDASGYTRYTLFFEADFTGAIPDPIDCVSFSGLTGLGENRNFVVTEHGGGALCSLQGVQQQGFGSGPLEGPDFVLTVDAAAGQTPPTSVTVTVYLH